MTGVEHRTIEPLSVRNEQVYGVGVHIRVLGPVEVVREGDLVRLGGPKQRTALALLVAEVGKVVFQHGSSEMRMGNGLDTRRRCEPGQAP